ncbi:MAG: FadR family transcriptional regulator [Lachnospiraceae bacterium]|nr:FadR family transcriptional regulator [Lachnospiraceae bacterium]
MALKKIKKQNISDIVFEQLQEQIINGTWEPGSKIPSETALSEELGVSRITVRNAFQRLISLGLIEAKQGGGTFVKDYTDADALGYIQPLLAYAKPNITYFLEFRAVMEPEMAALAAEKASDAQIAEMEQYAVNYAETALSDVDSLVSADMAFHFSIAEATLNPIIIKIYEMLREIYNRNLQQVIHSLGVDIGVKYHAMIVDSIRQHDPVSARRHMREHLQETLRLYQSKTGDPEKDSSPED